MLADERIAGFFEDTDVTELCTHLMTFLCHVTGWPVGYTGWSTREARWPGTTESDFAAVADHPRVTFEEFDVADEHAVVGEVASLKSEVTIQQRRYDQPE